MAHSADSDDQELSRRQREILQFNGDFIRDNGYPPTMREIASGVGLASPSSVAYQVSALKKKGYLSHSARRSRSAVVRVATSSAQGNGDAGSVPVQLVGSIHAGDTSLALEELGEVIALPEQLVGGGELIMLRVVGDSMINAAITDGDMVVVRKETDVVNGDIVAATFRSGTSDDDEATVKTFRKIDGRVWLFPQNPDYAPIPGDDARIIGKVVTVLRKL
jgi:repressor LexA